MSATARKRKEEVAQALKKLIQSKGKTPAMKYQQLFDDLRGQSEAVSLSQNAFPFTPLPRTDPTWVIITLYINSYVFIYFYVSFVAPGHHQGHVRRGAPSSHRRWLFNGHGQNRAPAVNTALRTSWSTFHRDSVEHLLLLMMFMYMKTCFCLFAIKKMCW